MIGLEKTECCPDCGSDADWSYDLQRCARCAPIHDAAWGVATEIKRERVRQIISEGFSPEDDDRKRFGDLARAAACYALVAAFGDAKRRALSGIHSFRNDRNICELWPWSKRWWKPKDRRRDLIRAAALIVAEIERLDRAAGKGRP